MGIKKKNMKELIFLYTSHSAWHIETPKMQTEIDQQTQLPGKCLIEWELSNKYTHVGEIVDENDLLQ